MVVFLGSPCSNPLGISCSLSFSWRTEVSHLCVLGLSSFSSSEAFPWLWDWCASGSGQILALGCHGNSELPSCSHSVDLGWLWSKGIGSCRTGISQLILRNGHISASPTREFPDLISIFPVFFFLKGHGSLALEGSVLAQGPLKWSMH